MMCQCDSVIRILRARRLESALARSKDTDDNKAMVFLARACREAHLSPAQVTSPQGHRQKRVRADVARYLRFTLKWKYTSIGAFLQCHHTTAIGACRNDSPA